MGNGGVADEWATTGAWATVGTHASVTVRRTGRGRAGDDL